MLSKCIHCYKPQPELAPPTTKLLAAVVIDTQCALCTFLFLRDYSSLGGVTVSVSGRSTRLSSMLIVVVAELFLIWARVKIRLGCPIQSAATATTTKLEDPKQVSTGWFKVHDRREYRQGSTYTPSSPINKSSLFTSGPPYPNRSSSRRNAHLIRISRIARTSHR